MDITPAPSNRANRFMLEGVGTRVIRGPDWKWGKQVSNLKLIHDYSSQSRKNVYFFFLIFKT